MSDDSHATPVFPISLRDVPTLSEELGASATARAKDRASLTMLTGDHAGTLIRLGDDDVVLGRGTDAGVHIADASLSRRHARFFRVEHQIYVQDLGSTNGTFVHGKRIESAVSLADGDHVQLGPNRVLRFNLENAEGEAAAIQLYESTVRDPTSGAFNRRHFDDRLEAEKAFAEHHGTPLALLLLDIDAFKWVNDAHGHVLGDAVLRVLAASVQRLLRPDDTLVRYGGDEFAVLCRDTSLRNGLILGERIRAGVERLPFSMSGNEFHVTISVGVAGSRSDEPGWHNLIDSADRAMYEAKRLGRNSVASSP